MFHRKRNVHLSFKASCCLLNTIFALKQLLFRFKTTFTLQAIVPLFSQNKSHSQSVSNPIFQSEQLQPECSGVNVALLVSGVSSHPETPSVNRKRDTITFLPKSVLEKL